MFEGSIAMEECIIFNYSHLRLGITTTYLFCMYLYKQYIYTYITYILYMYTVYTIIIISMNASLKWVVRPNVSIYYWCQVIYSYYLVKLNSSKFTGHLLNYISNKKKKIVNQGKWKQNLKYYLTSIIGVTVIFRITIHVKICALKMNCQSPFNRSDSKK